MTSIDYLIQELKKGYSDDYIHNVLIKQAKEMHKKEIIDAVDLPKNKRWYDAKLYNSCGEQYYQETFVSKGSDDHIVDTNEIIVFPKQEKSEKPINLEISDEEIEKASWKYEVRNKFDASFIREAFIKGCEWYKEQLKQRQ